VQRLAAHDETGAGGPAGQVDQRSELGDRGAGPQVPVLADRRVPPVIVERGPADRCVDGCVGASDHGEADVALPAVPDEVGAASRIDPHLDPSAHQRRVVAGPVADGDLLRQLTDRRVEDGDVIGDVVRPGVAGPQPDRQRLTRGISEAPRACNPTWATTPSPDPSTTTGTVLLAFTLRVPSWLRS
jgi:hypothetical protein